LSANHGFSAYYANNIHYHGVEAAFTNIDPATGLPNAYQSTGSEGHGIAFDEYASNSSVEHSYSHGNAGVGLMLSHESTNNSASYNVIANNGSLGVVINGGDVGSSNIAVINNTIYGNSYAGIAAWKPVTGLTIENNIVANNATYGLAFTYDGVTNYTVAANVISGNTLGATNGYVYGATGTILADPLLVAPASGNFSLQAFSPAINTGLTIGSPYQIGLAAGSVWPSSVLLLDQGVSPPWEIGAFVYAP
jgi:parallel beta helix pectate lyase-like protein